MITYLILANFFLAICYGFYHAFLRKDTFFQYNRLFLLSGVLLAFLLPLIDMSAALGESVAIYHVYLPAVHIGAMVAEKEHMALAEGAAAAAPTWSWLGWVYWAGCIITGLVFLYKLIMTIRLLRNTGGQQSFSFFGKVRIDKTAHQHDKIATHESVHAKQWHSLDVMLMEIIKVFNWFNPFVYLYAQALKLQHEYIADQETALNQPVQYAEILLSSALGVSRPMLTTPFADSRFLKQRVRMLLRSKSRKGALTKFVLVLPVVIAMLFISMSFSDKMRNPNADGDDTINEFRKELGRNIRYPLLAIENNLIGDVMTTYEKKDGEYSSINFLGNAHGDLKASVKETLERNSVKELAPEGKNYINVRFRIETDASVPPPPAPEGYRALNDVTIVGYRPAVPEKSTEEEKEIVFIDVEISPEPTGGMMAFREWIGQNYEFPQAAVDAGVNGTVEISFVVERDGSLSDIRIVRDLGHGTGEEAVRLFKDAPKWSPGIQNGRPVRVAYTLPIRLATQ